MTSNGGAVTRAGFFTDTLGEALVATAVVTFNILWIVCCKQLLFVV
jgi:hypothetical protein